MPYKLGEILPLLWRGQSIGRAMENIEIDSRARFEGLVLDVGAGWSEYGEALSRKGSSSVITLDLRTQTKPDVAADLEKGIPFRDNSLDGIFLNNVLEHVANIGTVISEAHRVLKPGGRFILTTPFLVPVHRYTSPDESYDDFWRFSDSAMRHLLRDFSKVDIIACNTGPFVGGLAISYYALTFRFIRIPAFVFMHFMDRAYDLLSRMRKDASCFSYPIIIYGNALK